MFLPGEFHGQKSMVGYSPRGHKESDMTERLALYFSAAVVLVDVSFSFTAVMTRMMMACRAF